jgi:hypothetical protein
MKNRFTLLIAFCLMAFAATAQVVDVVTGLSFPYGLALNGDDLYIAEGGANKISKIDITLSNPSTTDVVTGMSRPLGLFLDNEELYIGEYNAGRISKIDITQPSPIPATVATGLSKPTGLLLSGDILYISDEGDDRIYYVDISQPIPVLLLLASGFNNPTGMVLIDSVIYVAEFGSFGVNDQITKVDLKQSPVVRETFVTNVDQPVGISLNGNFIYIAEGSQVSKIDINQPNPSAEVVITGLDGSRLVAFDGIDMYIAQVGSGSAGQGKISKLEIGQPTFSTQPTICANAVPTDLGGASPTGGTYSGPGVTDDGNGETFTFDPVAAGGVGSYTITYTAINGQTATSTIEVVTPPTAMFTPPASVTVDAGVQAGLGGGTPTGGVYSGTGITDDGNGMTYSFDPAAAGVGMHTITYSYTDGNGCSDMAEGVVEVNAAIPPDNECSGANDINALFGQAENEPQTSGLYDNTDYNSTGDPATGYECFLDVTLENTIWFSFTGDGNNYHIRSVQCNATNYFDQGDTQAAIYSGDCGNLTPVACTEDEDASSDLYNMNVEVATQQGVTYYMMVDGWNGRSGEFCLEVTNLAPNAITNIQQTDIQLFPNPTTGEIQLTNVDADQVQVFDSMGRLLFSEKQPGNTLDISEMPAGVYFLKITEGEEVYSARVVKE